MATTFDPGRIAGGSLSGGNLVFTSSAGGSAFASRTLTGLSYAEITITTLTGVPSVGVVGQNWGGTQMGTDATSVGYLSSGAVKYNGTTLATLAAFVAGNRIGVAVDILNRLIWFRVNGGNWNGSALNDPATGVGGLSFATPPSSTANNIGTALFGVAASLTGTVWTANFSGAFTDVAPTGYITADTNQITLAKSVLAAEVMPVVALTTTEIAQTSAPPSGDKAYKAFFPAGTITKVSGTILELGATVAGKRVDVYDRNSGELLGTAFSASDGTWSVACLGRPSVRVVADDPVTYNSLVYDNVIPV